MYTKICPVCGMTFEAANSRYKYCSDECRKKRKYNANKAHLKEYYKTSRGIYARKTYYKKHHKPVEKYCADCGKKLDDGRQTWCLDCLLKDYAENNSHIAYQRLANRGYDRELIMEEINSRRTTICKF